MLIDFKTKVSAIVVILLTGSLYSHNGCSCLRTLYRCSNLSLNIVIVNGPWYKGFGVFIILLICTGARVDLFEISVTFLLFIGTCVCVHVCVCVCMCHLFTDG